MVVSATMALLAQFVSALQNASMEDAWNEIIQFEAMQYEHENDEHINFLVKMANERADIFETKPKIDSKNIFARTSCPTNQTATAEII